VNAYGQRTGSFTTAVSAWSRVARSPKSQPFAQFAERTGGYVEPDPPLRYIHTPF
jgi:hypothetical protein